MIPVAVGIVLCVFQDIFPFCDLAGVGNPYLLCMKALMQQLGRALAEHRPDDQLAIVHDQGDWDADALQSYSQMLDEKWEHCHRFLSITARSSREDVGLQSADLFAYESMRYLDDHNWTGENMRKPLQVLFGLLNRAAFGFHIGREYLELLRAELEKEGKLAPLEKVER